MIVSHMKKGVEPLESIDEGDCTIVRRRRHNNQVLSEVVVEHGFDYRTGGYVASKDRGGSPKDPRCS